MSTRTGIRANRATAVVIGVLCYIVALNVTAAAALVNRWLGLAVLILIALVAAGLSKPAGPLTPAR